LRRAVHGILLSMLAATLPDLSQFDREQFARAAVGRTPGTNCYPAV